MRYLKLKEVAEMVFKFMQNNKTNLLEAYEYINNSLGDANPYSYDTVKKYLFNNHFDK